MVLVCCFGFLIILLSPLKNSHCTVRNDEESWLEGNLNQSIAAVPYGKLN